MQVQRLQAHVDGEVQGTEGVKAAVMAGRGIRIDSARTVRTEPATGRIVRLEVQHMPRTLDRCVLPRRDTPLSAGQQRTGVLCWIADQALCDARPQAVTIAGVTRWSRQEPRSAWVNAWCCGLPALAPARQDASRRTATPVSPVKTGAPGRATQG